MDVCTAILAGTLAASSPNLKSECEVKIAASTGQQVQICEYRPIPARYGYRCKRENGTEYAADQHFAD